MTSARSRCAASPRGQPQRPVLVSRTAVQATCRGPRKLSDAHIKAIAATGGVMGIGYFEGAVCGRDTAAIVRAIQHVATIAGVKHVALGTDFDGAVKTAFYTTGHALITQGLINAGFSDADIADVMGGNVLRLLQAARPPG